MLPGAVALTDAPPLVIAPPGLTLTTVVPANEVLSAPPVAGFVASQVTLAVFSPAQAAYALCGSAATSATTRLVKAVLAASLRPAQEVIHGRPGSRTSNA